MNSNHGCFCNIHYFKQPSLAPLLPSPPSSSFPVLLLPPGRPPETGRVPQPFGDTARGTRVPLDLAAAPAARQHAADAAEYDRGLWGIEVPGCRRESIVGTSCEYREYRYFPRITHCVRYYGTTVLEYL